MLTRTDLENDVLRKSCAQRPELPVLCDTDFSASLERVLSSHPAGDDCWVFAYGSLIWNPLFDYVGREPATIHGFHRGFCMWSRLGRGSPERPGLMLALDRGGRCRGIAFRIAAAAVQRELTLIWRREMVMGSYSPRWVKTRVGSHQRRALAFVVNRDHPHYAGKLPTETIVTTLATAHGKFGSGAEYLFQTVAGLHTNSIHDPRLEHLRTRVLETLRYAGATA